MCVTSVAMLSLGLFLVESALYKKVIPGKTISLSEYRDSERVGALIGLLVFVDAAVNFYQYHHFSSLVAGTVIVLGGFLGYFMLNPKLGLVYRRGSSETTFVVTDKARLIVRAWAYAYVASILFVLCFLGD